MPNQEEIIKTKVPNPPEHPNAFLGREEDIKQIKALLCQYNVVQLNGIGGIGKSEICHDIFWKKAGGKDDPCPEGKPDLVGWIPYNISLKNSLHGQFKELPDSKECTDQEQYLAMVAAYADRLGRQLWLFVDNADTLTEREADWLSRLACRVILTSRTKHPHIMAYRIRKLSPENAFELYRNILHDNEEDENEQTEHIPDEETPYIRQILALADYHTKTVVLLAKTQRYSGISAKDLLEKLKQNGFNLTGIRENIDGEGTLSEQLNKIFKIAAIEDAEQLRILNGFAYLAPNTPVKADLLKSLFGLDTLDAANELARRGWLNRNAASFSIHPVIADTVLYHAQMDNTERKKTDFLLSLLFGKMIGLLHDSRGHSFQEQIALLPHCTAAAEKLEKSKDPWLGLLLIPTFLFNFLFEISWIFFETGNYDAAEAYGLKAMDHCQKDSPKAAKICNHLATVYHLKGDYNTALKYAQEDERITLANGGEGTPSIAATYYRIADIFNAMNDKKEALKYAKLAKDIDEEKYGKNHPKTAADYYLLAKIYLDTGAPDKALEYAEDAKKIEESRLPEDHPDLAATYHQLGNIYLDLNQPEDALKYAEAEKRIEESRLQEDHPNLAATYYLLGQIYLDLNQPEDAVKYAEDAKRIYESRLPEDHPDRAITYCLLGRIYLELNQPEDARKYAEKAQKIDESRLPEDHPDRARTYRLLGRIYLKTGNTADALTFAHKAEAVEEPRLGKSNRDTKKTYRLLAEIYEATGDEPKAAEYRAKADE